MVTGTQTPRSSGRAMRLGVRGVSCAGAAPLLQGRLFHDVQLSHNRVIAPERGDLLFVGYSRVLKSCLQVFAAQPLAFGTLAHSFQNSSERSPKQIGLMT